MKKKIFKVFVCCILFLGITGCSAKKKSLNPNKQTNVDLNVCDKEDYLFNCLSINVEQIINNIVSNGPNTSSNPFDYIKMSKEEYDELLNHPKETFEYAVKDLIETGAGEGLKSYIEVLLCRDINKNFQYDFDSGKDFLEKYEEFLTKSYSILNEYDKYALSLFEEYNIKIDDIDGISMTIKRGTLTKTGATVIINDLNGKGTNIYGQSYRIDKKENNKWKEVRPIHDNYGFNYMAYYVDENGKLEFQHNWEYIYGQLGTGEYRLVKYALPSASKDERLYFSVEFIIE